MPIFFVFVPKSSVIDLIVFSRAVIRSFSKEASFCAFVPMCLFIDLRFEGAYLRSERPDLRSERADMRSEL